MTLVSHCTVLRVKESLRYREGREGREGEKEGEKKVGKGRKWEGSEKKVVKTRGEKKSWKKVGRTWEGAALRSEVPRLSSVLTEFLDESLGGAVCQLAHQAQPATTRVARSGRGLRPLGLSMASLDSCVRASLFRPESRWLSLLLH